MLSLPLRILRRTTRLLARPLGHLLVLPLALAVAACGGAKSHTATEPTPATAGQTTETDDMHEHGHGHGHGGDVYRPVEETDEYIRRLERPERDEWQKPDEVVAALALRGDETIVDVGAGSGYFALRLARAVPRGRVVAVDIDPEMVAHLTERAAAEGVPNVEPRRVESGDHGAPADADLVFVTNVLHHVPDWPGWLGRLQQSVRPGTRLVVIEFIPEPTPMGPPIDIRIRPAALLEAALKAGWQPGDVDEALLPYQYMATFVKE